MYLFSAVTDKRFIFPTNRDAMIYEHILKKQDRDRGKGVALQFK